jgi:hypothetical protein
MWHHLDSDGPAIFLRDEVGTLRAALGTTYLPPRPSGAPETTPASSLVLFGKDGKVVQRLP